MGRTALGFSPFDEEMIEHDFFCFVVFLGKVRCDEIPAQKKKKAFSVKCQTASLQLSSRKSD